jgi:hypothetical protein
MIADHHDYSAWAIERLSDDEYRTIYSITDPDADIPALRAADVLRHAARATETRDMVETVHDDWIDAIREYDEREYDEREYDDDDDDEPLMTRHCDTDDDAHAAHWYYSRLGTALWYCDGSPMITQ